MEIEITNLRPAASLYGIVSHERIIIRRTLLADWISMNAW